MVSPLLLHRCIVHISGTLLFFQHFHSIFSTCRFSWRTLNVRNKLWKSFSHCTKLLRIVFDWHFIQRFCKGKHKPCQSDAIQINNNLIQGKRSLIQNKFWKLLLLPRWRDALGHIASAMKISKEDNTLLQGRARLIVCEGGGIYWQEAFEMEPRQLILYT